MSPEQRIVTNERYQDIELGQGFFMPPKKKQELQGNITYFLDWRTKNAVTPAKDQMKCAACYAFAANAALESAYAIKSGRLV